MTDESKEAVDRKIAESVKQLDWLIKEQRDFEATQPGEAVLGAKSPEVRQRLSDLLHNTRDNVSRLVEVRDELVQALSGFDRKTAEEALDRALILLEGKPSSVIAKSSEFDVENFLRMRPGMRDGKLMASHLKQRAREPHSTGRAMLSAVETTALAHGAGPSFTSSYAASSGEADERIRVYAAQHQRLAGASPLSDLANDIGPLNEGESRTLDYGDGNRVKVTKGGEPTESGQVEVYQGDVPDWFTQAMQSLKWDEGNQRFSSTLLRFDLHDTWERVYKTDERFEDAKQAAKRHADEMYAGRAKYPAIRKAPLAIAIALERYRAVLDDQSDNEAKRRVAVMLASTEVNIELTAASFAELCERRGKRAFTPYFSDDADVAHGFGTRSLMHDESLTWKRNAKNMRPEASNSDWTYSNWRIALESCAFPNVSDTIVAMQFASDRASKQMLNPPDSSPSNAEVRLMQLAYWAAMVCEAADKESRKAIDNGYLLDAYVWLGRVGELAIPRIIFDAVQRIAPLRAASTFNPDNHPHPKVSPEAWSNRCVEMRGYLRQWACTWRSQGYARIDVSHKLAAALMLTDVSPEIQVRGPWQAFSVHIPPGITRVSRVLVMSGETSDAEHKISPLIVIFEDGSFGEFSENHLEPRELELLENFVRGVCLAVEQGHAKHDGKHGTQGSKGQRKRFIGAPIAGERYQLAAPVKIDLREVVREHLDGKTRGGSPKVQFIVRGHWRDQAVGPKRSLRKRIWIEPFWKGDEAARVLLRAHQVEGDKLKEQPR